MSHKVNSAFSGKKTRSIVGMTLAAALILTFVIGCTGCSKVKDLDEAAGGIIGDVIDKAKEAGLDDAVNDVIDKAKNSGLDDAVNNVIDKAKDTGLGDAVDDAIGRVEDHIENGNSGSSSSGFYVAPSEHTLSYKFTEELQGEGTESSPYIINEEKDVANLIVNYIYEDAYIEVASSITLMASDEDALISYLAGINHIIIPNPFDTVIIYSTSEAAELNTMGA